MTTTDAPVIDLLDPAAFSPAWGCLAALVRV
jgi:hypothetical protein